MTTNDALAAICALPGVRLTVSPIAASWYAGINYDGGPLTGVRACRSTAALALVGVARQLEARRAAAETADLDDLLAPVGATPSHDDLGDLLG